MYAPILIARRLAGLAAVAVAAFAVSPAVGAAASCPNAKTPPAVISSSEFQTSMLCLLNVERHDHGLVALRGQAQLMLAATGHSESMRSLSYFDHTDPDGTTFLQRITNTGYLLGAKRWVIGENLAWGSYGLGTPRALVRAWMHSPEHRANVLESRFREVGIGAVSGSPINPSASTAITVTADFGLSSRIRRHRR